MLTHTPGKWEVVHRTPSNGYCSPMPEIRAGQTSIADIRWNGHNAEHGEANACLIAAAPDLLKALEQIVALEYSTYNYDESEMLSDAREIARQAIAQAKVQEA